MQSAPSPTLPTALAARLPAPEHLAAHDLLPLLHRTTIVMVRSAQPDLTQRQLGVFLTVYMEPGPHTVRGLAALLNVPKPSVTRALDRLSAFDLARRKVDPQDRRSVLVLRTMKGAALLREIGAAMGGAA